MNPGNRALLKNYLLFLLEIKQFEKFTTVMTHAKRVLDPTDIAQIHKIHSEFLKALGITAQQAVAAAKPVDDKPKQSAMSQGLKSSLKNFLGKRRQEGIRFQSSGVGIAEAENEEDES